MEIKTTRNLRVVRSNGEAIALPAPEAVTITPDIQEASDEETMNAYYQSEDEWQIVYERLADS